MTAKSPKDIPCDDLTGELLWEKEINVSPGFAKVLRKMLEVDVRARYKMADEVISDLDLVPYEQELNQSLSAKVTRKQPPTEENQQTDSTEAGYTSATTRLAMAIRARKSRKGKTDFAVEVNPQTILLAYGNGRKNFSQQNLSKLNLAQATLKGSNFRNCQLVKANFEEADLASCNFYNANLGRANLHKANLHKAYLLKSDLHGADLRGANLERADLTHANLKEANLCGANLTHAKVEEEQLQEAKTNWSTVFPDGKRRLW
jgi:serine/threonine-protein kinase